MPGLQESSVSLAAPFAPLESRQLGRAKDATTHARRPAAREFHANIKYGT